MKATNLIVLTLAALVSACAPSQQAIQTAIAKTEAATVRVATAKVVTQAAAFIATPHLTVAPCNAVCILAVHPTLTGDILQLDFELTNSRGNVEVGDKTRLTGNLLVGLFRVNADGSSTYLFGANVPDTNYECYEGNDIPWAGGVFSAMCSVAISLGQMQERPKIGDVLRIEANRDFTQQFVLR